MKPTRPGVSSRGLLRLALLRAVSAIAAAWVCSCDVRVSNSTRVASAYTIPLVGAREDVEDRLERFFGLGPNALDGRAVSRVRYAGRVMTLRLEGDGQDLALRSIFEGPVWLGTDLELYIERDHPGLTSTDVMRAAAGLAHSAQYFPELQGLIERRESGQPAPISR